MKWLVTVAAVEAVVSEVGDVGEVVVVVDSQARMLLQWEVAAAGRPLSMAIV